MCDNNMEAYFISDIVFILGDSMVAELVTSRDQFVQRAAGVVSRSPQRFSIIGIFPATEMLLLPVVYDRYAILQDGECKEVFGLGHIIHVPSSSIR